MRQIAKFPLLANEVEATVKFENFPPGPKSRAYKNEFMAGMGKAQTHAECELALGHRLVDASKTQSTHEFKKAYQRQKDAFRWKRDVADGAADADEP